MIQKVISHQLHHSSSIGRAVHDGNFVILPYFRCRITFVSGAYHMTGNLPFLGIENAQDVFIKFYSENAENIKNARTRNF